MFKLKKLHDSLFLALTLNLLIIYLTFKNDFKDKTQIMITLYYYLLYEY